MLYNKVLKIFTLAQVRVFFASKFLKEEKTLKSVAFFEKTV